MAWIELDWIDVGLLCWVRNETIDPIRPVDIFPGGGGIDLLGLTRHV
jgi:hypothetical protein